MAQTGLDGPLSRSWARRSEEGVVRGRLDRIVRIAAKTLDAPIAAISVIDGSRMILLAEVGLQAREVPRAGSLCERLVDAPGPLVVPDTLADPEARNALLVQGRPHVRFYIGVPLRLSDGSHIGSLCVMDTTVRPAPAQGRLAALQELAAMALDDITRPRDEAPVAPVSVDQGAHRNLLAAYAAKSEFLTSLSHELRTPLNAMIGYAGLIAGAPDVPGQTADHAGEIIAAARHMLALVNDILEYSRLEADRLPIGLHRVSLAPIVEAAVHMVAVFATSRGVRLCQQIDAGAFIVRGDPVRLKQVLLNLLTNAVKFTPRGGDVTVRLDALPGGEVEVSVADTGIGIAAEDIAQTLIPFGQIVQKDGAQAEGTGLGLPISKALVERHGGSLRLESEPGRGTIVYVRLPALSGRAQAEG